MARPWGLALLLAGMLGVACSTGAYPLDVFSEMHYQQSHRSQEPDRLPPPAQSVPVTGKEIPYPLSDAAPLLNPVPRTPQTLERATQLYRVNCAVCHGSRGRGDAPVMSAMFRDARAALPADFASERVRGRTDGELYWFISNGAGEAKDFRGLTNMPSFRSLLTEEERWTLVHFIRSVQGR